MTGADQPSRLLLPKVVTNDIDLPHLVPILTTSERMAKDHRSKR